MNNKIAIVTGVSRLKGIGRAICCELAKGGFDIFFTYWTEYDKQMPWKIDANEPELIQQEIRNLGVKCEKLELDLSVENAFQVLFKKVKNQLGSPLVLVNNATYSTQYLHMSKRAVKVGDYVKQGDVIGYVGMTGNTGGPHVCYRFWKNGQQVDPFKEKLPEAEPISEDLKVKYLDFIEPIKMILDNIPFTENEPLKTIEGDLVTQRD